MELWNDYKDDMSSNQFEYCVESYEVGQKKQARQLLQQMVYDVEMDKIKFALVEIYTVAPGKTLRFLLDAKDKYGRYILSLTNIVNAFYDYDRSNYETIKEEIQFLTDEIDI